MDVEQIELLPCPFCGHPGQFKKASGSYGYYPSSVAAGCSNCAIFAKGSYIDDGHGDYPGLMDAHKIAARSWNTRNGVEHGR